MRCHVCEQAGLSRWQKPLIMFAHPLVCRFCGARHKRRAWNFRLPAPVRWVLGFIHDLLAMVAYIPVYMLFAWVLYYFPYELSAWWLSGVIFLLVYAIGLTLPYELNEMDPTNERIQRIRDKKSKLDSTDADPQA